MHIHKQDQAALDRFAKANNGAVYSVDTNKAGRVTALTVLGESITNLEPLSELSSLTILDLSGNKIADVGALSGLSSLTSLDLRVNKIADVGALSGLSSLTYLDLRVNKIADVGALSGLSSLTSLDLRVNKIADVGALSGLSSLTGLYLSENQISDVEALSGLSSLTELYLSENQIADVGALSGLSSLTTLNLSENQIADVEALSGLSSLTYLDLRDNQIEDVSPLSKLNNLNVLNLSRNPISDLSPITDLISQMDALYWDKNGGYFGLHLGNVKTQIPPTDIVQQGKDAVVTWFDAKKEDAIQPLNQVKVMLIGDGAAGKTSLVQRIQSGTFDPDQNQTNGIRIEPWTLENSGDPIEVKFWDFGGQEIMHATHQFFMTQRCLYVVVQSAREKDNTIYWLDHIKSFAPRAKILVVVNKIDINPGFSLDQEQLRRDYPNIIDFHETSCSEGEGIDAVVASLRQELPKVDLVRSLWLSRWFDVKKALEDIDKPYIKMESYEGICTQNKITNPQHRDVLLRYLNDLGVMLWFDNHQMQDFQVLNPEWATNGVYKIITSKQLAKANGILNMADLPDILPTSSNPMAHYDRSCYRFLIDLMQEFELCFPVKDNATTILVPSLLDKTSPKDLGLSDDLLHFVMSYSFLPPSLIPRLMVRLHDDLEQRWRTGMILNDPLGDARAVIVARQEEKTIEIKVSGQRRRDYFVTLRYFLHTINKGFDGVEVSETIVPSGMDRLKGINYETLINAEKERIKKIPHLNEIYSVSELLGGVRLIASSEKEMVKIIAEKALEIQDKRPIEKADELAKGMVTLNLPFIGIDIGTFIKAVRSTIDKLRGKK